MTTPMTEQRYDGPLPLRYKLSGAAVLVIAPVVTKLPFWVWLNAVKFNRRMCYRTATLEHGLMLLEGVRWAGRFWPGRCACFESTLGACLAGIFFLSSPVWCYGSQFRPMKHHAWLEVDGLPIGQSVDPAKEWRYKPLVRA